MLKILEKLKLEYSKPKYFHYQVAADCKIYIKKY